MRGTGISKPQYLLYSLMILVLTGCGANNLTNLVDCAVSSFH